MNLINFFKNTDLENTFVIGFYGGTNFGDELLLEIIQNFLLQKKLKSASIYYTDLARFNNYHHDFGFTLVDPKNKINFIKKLIHSKSIVIGGGGLWGLDTNINILLLSIILLILRFLFGKKIYVISVGYYNSTNILGHLAAKITAFSANILFVRDRESYVNFKKVTKNVILDKDLSFYLSTFNLKKYEKEAYDIINEYKFNENIILIGLRRFKKNSGIGFTEKVLNVLPAIKENLIIIPFEGEHISKVPFGKKIENSSVKFLNFKCNPIAFYVALKKRNRNIIIIAPQYHIQIVAHLSKISFMPISYDNKVNELHKIFNIKYSLPIDKVGVNDIISFIKNNLHKR